MATDRKAEVTWQGDLMSGNGRVDSGTSGAFGGLDVSWPARSEEPEGKTSPEELIAAAHATCFSMALSHGLAEAGHPAEELKTSATVRSSPAKELRRSRSTSPAASQESTRVRSSRQRTEPNRTVRCRRRSQASRKSASPHA